MTGIFGIADRKNDHLTSLGFIVTNKFQSAHFTDLKWADTLTSELVAKSRVKSGETKMVCNQSDKESIRLLK